MKQPGAPAVRIGLAAVVATAGIVLAVLVDQRMLSALFACAGAAAALWVVGTLRPRNPRLALRGAGVVVGSVLLVGIPAVVLLTPGATSSAEERAAEQRVEPNDLSGALARALDRADEIAPNGAESILQIELEGDRETVYVLNQQTGERAYTYRTGDSGWWAPTTMRTAERTVFGRAELARLDLNATRDRVLQAWSRIAAEAPSDAAAVAVESVTIEPRSSDGTVVAQFAGGAFPIEADTAGTLADTVDAASIGDFLEVAERTMTAAGLDPAATVLREISFRSLDDGASRHGRFAPGFDLQLDGGPVSSIAVDAGAFPVIRKATVQRDPDGFSLTGLTGATMVSVRDDLVRRGRVPGYDRDVIGAKIGVARSDDRPGRVPVTIQMVVGPSSAEVSGVYTTGGRFLRDGVH